MRRENRSGRPGGDRPHRETGARRPGERSSHGSQQRSSSGRGREQFGGQGGMRSSGRNRTEGDHRGFRPSGRGRAEGDQGGFRQAGRTRVEGDQGGFRQKGRSERSFSSGKGTGSPKKLVLKREKRPSRGQLMKELGYAPDHKPFRGDSGKKSTGKLQEIKSDLIRLNRFIANAGICSRREADTYIAAGVVTVNGQVVTQLGTKVNPGDEVRFDGRLITPERKVYLLLNKPKDFVTTTDDPHATHTVMDLIKNACPERIYPVGRLDRNTTGLLLFTNDGDMAKRLSHPSHQVQKVYQVTLDKNVSVNDIQKIADGIELEDGPVAADAITYVEGQDKNTVGIEIHSGRNRIVRRIFEQLGYRVKALDRVSYAGLTKKNIPRGKWRFLTPPEVSYLKMK